MALKLQINQPVELALTRQDPKVYEHDGRTSYMYSIVRRDNTEDKAFLTASCSQTIAELRIQPREWFTICRRKTGQGAEFYEVHTCANSARTGTVTAPPAVPGAPAAPQPKEMGQARNSASSVMGAALIAAIDAASQAEKYAASRGITLEFGPEDLRAIANTLYIQACKDPLFQERVA